MGKNKIKNWKETVAEVYARTPKKNGKVQWTIIVEEVEKVHKNIFKDCKNPAKKLQDLFRSAAMKEMVANYEAAAATTVEPTVKETAPAKKTTKVCKEKEHSYSETTTTESIEEKKNKDGSRSKTVDVLTAKDMSNMSDADILTVLGYNPEHFKLVSSSCRRGTWQAQSTDEGVIDLCSYRINGNVRPRTFDEVSEEQMHRVLREICEGKTVLGPTTAPKPEGDKIAILSIADLHLGKLAWANECGESYDHKIAIKRFNHIVNSGIDRLQKEEGIEKIIFFWSQDFFHFDSATRF